MFLERFLDMVKHDPQFVLESLCHTGRLYAVEQTRYVWGVFVVLVHLELLEHVAYTSLGDVALGRLLFSELVSQQRKNLVGDVRNLLRLELGEPFVKVVLALVAVHDILVALLFLFIGSFTGECVLSS